LGEKYLEIFPGKSKTEFVSANDTLVGHDPISVEAMTEDMQKLVASLTEVVDGVKEGRGTLGKLVKDEAMYDDVHRFVVSLNEITDNLKQGKGTMGKFFYNDSIYDNLEEFVVDLKTHPWKLFSKPKEETSSAQPSIRKTGR